MSGPDAELTAEQAEQVAERDRLTRYALLATGHVMRGDPRTRELLGGLPQAVYDRALVSAAIGFLISAGYTTAPDNDAERWLPLDVPEHLRPDFEAMAAGNRQMRDAIFGPRTDPTARNRQPD